MEELSGVQNIADLHREFVDGIVVRNPATGHIVRRIPEVHDCWFESGCMPYAQVHYTFEKWE